MAEITALFFDIGGVLLTNGWDQHARRLAAERFGLDWGDFQDRHQRVADEWEVGALTLDDYLRRTVFYRERGFSSAELRAFIFAQSKPHPDALAFARALADSGRYLLAALNNESAELNGYRIERFGLRSIFTAFFSSCFMGDRKPDEGMYRRALQITQREPGECVFIDDRPLNIEVAALVGLRAIHYRGLDALRSELAAHGVTA